MWALEGNAGSGHLDQLLKEKKFVMELYLPKKKNVEWILINQSILEQSLDLNDILMQDFHNNYIKIDMIISTQKFQNITVMQIS